MISIERFSIILDEQAALLPDEIFKNLNLGVIVSVKSKREHRVRPNLPVYILGEYRVHPVMGRGVVLYYGSFCEVFSWMQSEEEFRIEIDKVLKHELTHHLESQAGNRELEMEDAIRLKRFNRPD
ncbi:MAG: hypothetical protein GX781_05995 [Clostridiales bacterium]|nr:hypothetical protein [Clostridiales bacterium]